MRKTLILMTLLLIAPLVAPTIMAQTTSVTQDLVCPCGCGMVVSNCDCATAGEVRTWVEDRLREGETRQEILDLYSQKYGPEYIATQPKSGFGLSLWLFPLAALLIGAGVVYAIIQGRGEDKYEDMLKQEYERQREDEK